MSIEAQLKEKKWEHQRLETKIDRNWDATDRYVKAQEGSKQEFVALKQEVKQIKGVLKEKLGVEIRAL